MQSMIYISLHFRPQGLLRIYLRHTIKVGFLKGLPIMAVLCGSANMLEPSSNNSSTAVPNFSQRIILRHCALGDGFLLPVRGLEVCKHLHKESTYHL